MDWFLSCRFAHSRCFSHSRSSELRAEEGGACMGRLPNRSAQSWGAPLRCVLSYTIQLMHMPGGMPSQLLRKLICKLRLRREGSAAMPLIQSLSNELHVPFSHSTRHMSQNGACACNTACVAAREYRAEQPVPPFAPLHHFLMCLTAAPPPGVAPLLRVALLPVSNS